jgi:hypothetical protein
MTRFRFDILDDLTEGPNVAISVTTPDGKGVQLYGEVVLDGRCVVVRQFAIYGAEVTAGYLGLVTLRAMARDAMETFDVDTIRIEEARRISGANPGRTLTLTFFRSARPDDSGIAPPLG